MVTARVVVVGAGPSGLAASYLLAESGCNVTLVDKLTDPTKTDPSRSYSYLVSDHGMATLERMNLLEAIADAGVIANQVDSITYETGKTSYKSQSFARPGDKRHRYFISREKLLSLFLHRVREQKLVDVRLGLSVSSDTNSIKYTTSGVTVQLVGKKNEIVAIIQADLILACDGFRSIIRKQLEQGIHNIESSRGFSISKFSSPSTGLVYKSLIFKPSPKFPPLEKNHSFHIVQPNELVQIRSKRSFISQLQLVIFPASSDPNAPRIGSIATYRDAKFWRAKNVNQVYEELERNFPYIDFRSVVENDEIIRFAQAKPGNFPPIQRCDSLAGWCGENVGVALLGDAAKCFPPDLAQGLNSSLEDVHVFVDALEQSSCVHQGVQLYEQRRNEDISALMRLMRIGFPYQYRQNILMYNLSLLNIVFRKVLASCAPRWFHPPSIVLFSDTSYSDAMKKADETTTRLYALSIASLGLGLAIVLNRRSNSR